jgi:hypothetical protein
MLLYGHSYNAMVGVYVLPNAHNFQHKKKLTLLAKGEETTTPQATRASNSSVIGTHVH